MRLIDADALISIIKIQLDKSETLFNDVMKKFIDILEHSPTIDAVSVVRCKECWHGKRIVSADGVFTHMCDISDLKWRADDFCSYGERGGE